VTNKWTDWSVFLGMLFYLVLRYKSELHEV